MSKRGDKREVDSFNYSSSINLKGQSLKRNRNNKNAFFSKNRRGLSEIVANLLIILLVLVAVGVVWVVVRNVISSGSEEIELGQFTFDLSIKSAYVSGTNIVVAVRRSPGGGELLGMKFIFSNETESKIIEKRVAMDELDEKTFTFSSTEIPGIGAGDEVSVAPLYVSSGTEKSGNPTDSTTISGTSPGGGGNGGAVCGNAICEAGETAASCPADCTGAGGSVCGDGTCDTSTENALNCPADCSVPSSCDGTWNAQDVTDGNECDGTPTPNGCSAATCTCNLGFSANLAGGCTLNPAVDTGVINSVWNNIYFDSQNLPKSAAVSDYIGNYVNFSSSAETSCFLITFADYLASNDISYLRLDDSLGAPNINAGEGYSVWEAENCGQ